jgi:hypothetical protein
MSVILRILLGLLAQIVPQGGITVSGSSPAFLFYGYGCNGTSTNTCTIGGTAQGAVSTFALAAPITTGADAMGYTVQACGVYMNTLDSTNKGFSCAIYPSGPSVSPVCVITSGTNATLTGWSENTNFSGCTLAGSTAYVICYQVQGGGTSVNQDATAGVGFHPGATYPTPFPAPSSPQFQTGNVYSQYIRVAAN